MSKKGIALFLAFLMLFSIFTPQMTTYAATTENIEEVTTSEDTNENDLEQSTEEPENTGQNTEVTSTENVEESTEQSTEAEPDAQAAPTGAPVTLSDDGKELEADAVSVMIESGLGLELTDARKDHLADHYRDFKAEIKQELGKDFTDEAMIQKIDDMLSSVYSTYNDIVEDLNKSIEKYVPQERLLEYQKNNEVSHEQLPKKDIDVAPEMDMDYDLEM